MNETEVCPCSIWISMEISMEMSMHLGTAATAQLLAEEVAHTTDATLADRKPFFVLPFG